MTTQLLKILVFSLALSISALAQPADVHILYSLDADVNGDGVEERLLVGSPTSGDPTAVSAKDFVICERVGDKFKPVYTKSLGTNSQFQNKVASFQWQGPDTIMAGITTRPVYGQPNKPPEIWVVFVPSSDGFLSFRYNGKTYEEIVHEYE